MKKVLFLAALVIGFAITSNAQSTVTIALAAGDTVNNTGSASKVVSITGGYSGIAITGIATKISGTVGGTLGVYGSPDGTNYDLIGSAFTPTNVASQSKTFYITAPLPRYIKIQHDGTGTMSSVLTVKYVLRKYQAQ